MNDFYDVIDMVGMMADDTEPTRKSVQALPPDEALLTCLNNRGEVDMPYLAALTDLPYEKIAYELRGVIFQDPELLPDEGGYDITIGWQLSSRYLSGNIRQKLTAAEEANKRFPGAFRPNVERLRRILPERVGIGDIHLSLGATWIPAEEVALFLKKLLNLKTAPEVHFYEDLLTYKIIAPPGAERSIPNTVTYGVKATVDIIGGSYVKQCLTALDIVEQTMNAKTVKVFDYVPKKGKKTTRCDPILNKEKTVEAQGKQQAISLAFREYVFSDRARVRRFEQYYNDSMVGYGYSPYDGTFLRLPDMNPSVTLYPHQRNAIARVLLSRGNLLLAHDVGTGKTYEMVVSMHELYRMGLSRKNLMIVPNNVLRATVEAHALLYPNDTILAIYPKDFTPERRMRALEKIRDGDYVAIYMAYSGFDMIPMSKEYYIDKQNRELEALDAAIFNSMQRDEVQLLKSKRKALVKKLEKFEAETKPYPYIAYDKLGIETLVVDEAHNYKNIPINSRADGIIGMGGESRKCREMLEKAHFTNRLLFATGTPLTNSLADLFAFQTYLQPRLLSFHRIGTFDAWVNTFGERKTTVECDVDSNSNSMRTMTRFASFHNLSELMGLFSQVCDFHHIDENTDELPPFRGYTDITVPRNEAQHSYIAELSARTEDIRARRVSRDEDNLLKVTIDGRLAALDIRLVKRDPPPFSGGKTKCDACAEEVHRIYLAHPESVQVVFSDIGTPKAEFNVYDELAYCLIGRGIPRNEIAFVHDATSEGARAKLFAAMNAGTVRVVIGSTQKLGVGVNVQERLVALHHLSVPWRPADMVQREGRILRRGNTSPEVFILRYITEGTFDAYSWQLLENKQRFISSFLSGSAPGRDMQDISDTVLSYAEVKALAIGNPLIRSRVETANELERAMLAARGRQKEIVRLRASLEAIPAKLSSLQRTAWIADRDRDWFEGKRSTVSREERLQFGEQLLSALRANEQQKEERAIGDYRGFKIILPADMSLAHAYVWVKSVNGGKYRCEMELDGKTALGCTRSLDYLLEHFADLASRLRAEYGLLLRERAEGERDLARENPHHAEVERLKAKLAKIDRRLAQGADTE